MLTPRFPLAAAALTALLLGCNNAGDNITFAISQTGTVDVGVFLDRDGSRTLTPQDTVLAGARVALLGPSGGDTVLAAATGANGAIKFTQLPLGTYRVAVVPASVGDTVQVQEITNGTVTLLAADTAKAAVVRVGYNQANIRQIRSLPQGTRILLRAQVLSGAQQFRDTTAYVADSSGTLRLTRAINTVGATSNNPGDSVAALGTVRVRDGQPVLDDVRLVTFFRGAAPPVPLPLGTATAASADGGRLDAAFVLITGAAIADTATVAPDFRVNVSDGTGQLEVLLDGNIAFNRAAFNPGRTVNARGVLVPAGQGRWRLKPRSTADVQVF